MCGNVSKRNSGVNYRQRAIVCKKAVQTKGQITLCVSVNLACLSYIAEIDVIFIYFGIVMRYTAYGNNSAVSLFNKRCEFARYVIGRYEIYLKNIIIAGVTFVTRNFVGAGVKN